MARQLSLDVTCEKALNTSVYLDYKQFGKDEQRQFERIINDEKGGGGEYFVGNNYKTKNKSHNKKQAPSIMMSKTGGSQSFAAA